MKPSNSFTITSAAAVIFLTQLSGCNLKPSDSSVSNGLPSPITVAETLSANDVCAHGGIRLVYGLDHDGNGSVGPYESIGMEYLCSPSASDETGPRVVTIGDGVPQEDKQKYLRQFNES